MGPPDIAIRTRLDTVELFWEVFDSQEDRFPGPFYFSVSP